MSARRRVVALSPPAQRDYEDILLHSLHAWGEQQEHAYRETFDRALKRLAEYPEIGKAIDDTRAGYRSLPVGQHIIYYQVEDTAIRISRILHSRQDIEDALDEVAPV